MITTACVSEISGIGLDLELAEADQMPSAISPSESTIMTKRWCSAKRSSLAIMVYCAFSSMRAVDHDAVAGLQPAQHRQRSSPVRSPGFDLDRLEAPAARLHATRSFLPSPCITAPDRHHRQRPHGIRVADGAEHLRPQAARADCPSRRAP